MKFGRHAQLYVLHNILNYFFPAAIPFNHLGSYMIGTYVTWKPHFCFCSCWSQVGMNPNGPTRLNLGDGCWKTGIVIHELMVYNISNNHIWPLSLQLSSWININIVVLKHIYISSVLMHIFKSIYISILLLMDIHGHLCAHCFWWFNSYVYTLFKQILSY